MRAWTYRAAALTLVSCGQLLSGCDAGAAIGDPCITTRECPGLVCDTTQAMCVECLAERDCRTAGDACIANECVPQVRCDTSRECPDQVCDTSRGVCVDCVMDVDCLVDGMVCEANLCVDPPPSCRSDRECSALALVCDVENEVCVTCVRDADCEDDQRCTADHRCVRRTDAGLDAGGARVDAGMRDAGRLDAGHDAGAPDAGSTDGGPERDGGIPACDEPAAGNLVITEVMVASVSGSGDLGEWFEVENRSACAINLAGVTIRSPDAGGAPITHPITGLIVAAGDRIVFAQSGDTDDNHGLAFDYVYGAGTTGVVLNNGADSLTLQHDGHVIDHVEWSSAPLAGTSRQLDPSRVDDDNRLLEGAAYCQSTAIYATDTLRSYFGTPGLPNDDC